MALRPTEQANPLSVGIDAMTSIEFCRVMNRLDADVPLAVAEVLPRIAAAIDVVAARMAEGGRLFYFGAGTSGRLGVLDATELLPTFGLDPSQSIGLIAGGSGALVGAIEGAEDDPELAVADLASHGLGPADVVIGIAASGGTPYVLGGLGYAREVGAASISIACNPDAATTAAADIGIEVVPGPEILTGSTRLRAGTAQKLVLNMISTGSMVQLGKTYTNLMVDVQPTNAKLRDRAERIVATITDADPAPLLAASEGDVKVAVVMGLTDTDAATARELLLAAKGRVRGAVSTG